MAKPRRDFDLTTHVTRLCDIFGGAEALTGVSGNSSLVTVASLYAVATLEVLCA